MTDKNYFKYALLVIALLGSFVTSYVFGVQTNQQKTRSMTKSAQSTKQSTTKTANKTKKASTAKPNQKLVNHKDNAKAGVSPTMVASSASHAAQALTPLEKPVVDAVNLPLSTGERAVEPKKASEKISVNFVNADVEQLVKALGPAAGKPTVFVDPRIKSTLSFSLERPLPPEDVWDLLVMYLKSMGFSVVETADLVRVVLDADARLQPGAVIGSDQNLPVATNSVVTRFYRLSFDSVNNAQNIIRQYVSPTAVVNAISQTNTLVVTDFLDNQKRIELLLGQMDSASNLNIETIPIKNAAAVDVANLVARLLEDGRLDQNARGLILADPRTNSLLVRVGSKERLNVIRNLVERLDLPNARAGGMYYVPLKNSDANKMAQILKNLMTADTSATAATGAANPTAQSTAPRPTTGTESGSTGSSNSGQNSVVASLVNLPSGAAIQPDVETNSLIILASEPVYRSLRGIIEQLDVRRPQVFVETLVVEISADKTSEIGFQWQGGALSSGETAGVYGVSAGGNIAGSSNIVGLQTAIAAGTASALPNSGLTLAWGKKRFDTVNIIGMAKFLEENADANVLATPNILTSDNVEAKIVIGQNVPFLTGQYAQTGSGTNNSVNPFQTYERKDVGLTLKITPQILDQNSVKLQVYQEVSSVNEKEVAGGVVTSKRVIETMVRADDGQLIVLGGLIQDTSTNNESKVPVLGDIPIIGRLFRYEKNTRKKTNLIVFLRPYILRDAKSNQDIVVNRYDLLNRAKLQYGEAARENLENGVVSPASFVDQPVRAPNPTADSKPKLILPSQQAPQVPPSFGEPNR